VTSAVLDPARLPAEHTLPAIPYRMRGYDGPTTTADLTEECRELAEGRAAIQGPYARRPGDVRALLWRARALDIPIGVALDHIFIGMNGRAGLSARLIAALLRRAGITWTTAAGPHRVTHTFTEEVWYLTRAGVIARRKVKRGSVSYSLDDARAARIATSQHWQRWPVACMWARAMAAAGRELFPDVTMGFAYTPEEVATNVDEPGPAVAGIDADVLEVVEQARSEDATPDMIKTEIMPRVRSLLKRTATPDGHTLAQVLADIWQWKAEQAAAAAADQALTAVTEPADQPADATGWEDAPAGDRTLPCGCPASILTGDGRHLPEVHTDAPR
jgi:hypothetical protein